MEATQDAKTWLSFLLSDSAFPGGALANSQGLESAVLHEAVKRDDNKSLLTFINLSLEQAVHNTLPFVSTAHHIGLIASEMTTITDHASIVKAIYHKWYCLDKYEHAFLSNEINRRASINQGKCFVRVVQHAFPSVDNYIQSLISTFSVTECPNEPSVAQQQVHFHYAPVFGLVCKYMGLSMELCAKMYLRMLLRDMISAAVRLGLLGPLDGVKLQVEAFPVLGALLQQFDNESESPQSASSNGINAKTSDKSYYEGCYTSDNCRNMDNAETSGPLMASWSNTGSSSAVLFYRGVKPVQTAHILDLLQSRQDMLYSRLFSS